MIMLADPFHRRANKNVNFKYTLRQNHGLEWIHTRRRCLLLLLSISQTDVQSPRRPRPSTPAFLAFETKDDEETKTRTPINMCTAATQSTLWSYLNLSLVLLCLCGHPTPRPSPLIWLSAGAILICQESPTRDQYPMSTCQKVAARDLLLLLTLSSAPRITHSR